METSTYRSDREALIAAVDAAGDDDVQVGGQFAAQFLGKGKDDQGREAAWASTSTSTASRPRWPRSADPTPQPAAVAPQPMLPTPQPAAPAPVAPPASTPAPAVTPETTAAIRGLIAAGMDLTPRSRRPSRA